MGKPSQIISLDPIDRKKKIGLLEKMVITRRFGGSPVKRMQPFGHYMFCGEQGSGKTASALWYAEKLTQKYKRKGRHVKLFSNIGVGIAVTRDTLFDIINDLNPDDTEIRIVIIDEIHTYFPKDGLNKKTREITTNLLALFSQLRKRSTFILSTAQIYGRLDKSLREQCLYMIDCHLSFNKNKLVNEFIPQKDIITDDLGRWAGRPKKIYVHGLSKVTYDTKKIIRE